MQYHTVLITTGISLFVPSNIYGRITRELEIVRFEGTNPIVDVKTNINAVVQKWMEAMNFHLEEAMQTPLKVSAEYSVIYRLAQINKLHNSPHIILFHTDTFGGIAASKLLSILFKKHFNAQVRLVQISELDVKDRLKLNRSLGYFMGQLSDFLLAGDPRSTLFAPIGGYKVMTSFAYIVGSYFGYYTAYLNEDEPILHMIPPVPIKMDKQLLVNLQLLIKRMIFHGLIEWDALTHYEKEMINQNGSLFEMAEDYVTLNPFGLFICEQKEYASLFKTKVYISEQIHQMIKLKQDLKQFFYQQTGVLLKKILDHQESKGEHFKTLFHESDFEVLKGKKLFFHLYKGASKSLVYRVSWGYDENKDELFLNYFWKNHDLYEIEAKKGIGLKEEYGNFINITEPFYETQ